MFFYFNHERCASLVAPQRAVRKCLTLKWNSMLQMDRCGNLTDAEFLEHSLAWRQVKGRGTATPGVMSKIRGSTGTMNRMVKKGVMRLLAVMAGGVALGFLVLFVVAPNLNWSATARPRAIEKSLAGLVLHRWIQRHAAVQNNPLPRQRAESQGGPTRIRRALRRMPRCRRKRAQLAGSGLLSADCAAAEGRTGLVGWRALFHHHQWHPIHRDAGIWLPP